MFVDPSTLFCGIRALYGENGFEKLQKSHVMVIGVGGVGSWICEAMCRSGVGKLTLIDDDSIESTNSNRQLHTTTETVGRYKADVLSLRLKSINPSLDVVVKKIHLTPENIPEILKDAPQYVAEAIDELQTKAAVIDFLAKRNATFVLSGGASGRTDPMHIKMSDLAHASGDALLSNLRTILRKRYGYPRFGKKMGLLCVYSDETAKYAQNPEDGTVPRLGAAVTVTASFGLLMASYLLNIISSEA